MFYKLATFFKKKIINSYFLSAMFGIVLFYSITSVSSPKVLGPNICQGIWTAAGNNLKVPLELRVDLTGGTNQVFTPEPAGNTKIASEVFSTFKGNSGPYHNNHKELSLKLID